METKIMGATPKWFAELLSELQIYPTSFSKYGNVYRREIAGFDYMDRMVHRVENWESLMTPEPSRKTVPFIRIPLRSAIG